MMFQYNRLLLLESRTHYISQNLSLIDQSGLMSEKVYENVKKK